MRKRTRNIVRDVNSEEFKDLIKKTIKEEVDLSLKEKRSPLTPWIDGNQPYTITYGMTGGEAHDKKDK